eukprot:1106044-Prymnesium_polylepis.1
MCIRDRGGGARGWDRGWGRGVDRVRETLWCEGEGWRVSECGCDGGAEGVWRGAACARAARHALQCSISQGRDGGDV